MAATGHNDGQEEPVQLSVVVPVYNEEENLDELYQRIAAALGRLMLRYEIVLVNDGSVDGTPAKIAKLQEQDPDVVAIHLSRNFGHQAAVSAGLDFCAGNGVIIMDGDLQDPPEVFDAFVKLWQQEYEVVYAVRQKRKEAPLKRLGYYAFYRLLRSIADLDIPLDSGDFCLLDRKVVNALKQLPEQQRFIRGLRTFVGFRQIGLCYEREARRAGKSKYTIRALISLATDGLVSFSSYPLRLVTYLGITAAGLAVLLTIWAVVDAIYNSQTPRGWASTIIVVLFMSAIQLVSLGIMGEYVRRIFLECKRRPTYIVREITRRTGPRDEPRRS
jgi:polyisoprenyl-phosphate glycosyltransferase